MHKMTQLHALTIHSMHTSMSLQTVWWMVWAEDIAHILVSAEVSGIGCTFHIKMSPPQTLCDEIHRFVIYHHFITPPGILEQHCVHLRRCCAKLTRVLPHETVSTICGITTCQHLPISGLLSACEGTDPMLSRAFLHWEALKARHWNT